MSGTPRRTLLVGCGKLGTRLGRHLVECGDQVFALRRNIGQLPSSFAAIEIDLALPAQPPLPDVDAMVITLTPGSQDPPGSPDAYVTALDHLAAALPRVPNRVVYVSSTRVFEGRTDERALTEDDDPKATTDRGRMLLAGEARARELFNAHILRPAGIYGPGREFLIRTVRAGAPVQYARRTNRIHETDLVRALKRMLADDAPPSILHAVDQSPAPLGEVVAHIAERLSIDLPPRLQPEVESGTILSGARLLDLLGSLSYPTYRSGYDDAIVRLNHRE
ncbi:MAG: sugar nucleotide-binding protein [Mycetocola sp.]